MDQLEAALANKSEPEDPEDPTTVGKRPPVSGPPDPDTIKPPFYVRRSLLHPFEADVQNAENQARAAEIADLKAFAQTYEPEEETAPTISGQSQQPPEQAQQQQPKVLSEQNQTSGLASSLSNASMSAKPTSADSTPSTQAPTSLLQSQQAAATQPTAKSSAASVAPPQQQPQNPLQGAVTAFKGFFGGDTTAGQQPASKKAAKARKQALPPAQQKQIPPMETKASKAAQRMAASQQALAKGPLLFFCQPAMVWFVLLLLSHSVALHHFATICFFDTLPFVHSLLRRSGNTAQN